MHLGVCYYPEQWPRDKWKSDAKRMAALGITRVRIAEFAWSRMEPAPGCYDWAWLDTAIDTLAAEGLKVILGTPTAAPPKWLVDSHPDILPIARDGMPWQFGSRRHYDISSEVYREHCARIVEAMTRRYGQHPAVIAWQTDNELGCHNTLPSYSRAALQKFRRWLAARYGEIAALNMAWGNVFWSMEYRSFDEIELPLHTPTDANPAHVLDFRRFVSDEVADFHALQAKLIRAHSPGRDVLHNFMGFFTAFDHYVFAERGLDVAAWDSYPIPRTEVIGLPEEDKHRWARTGHPDVSAFSHDLYRGIGRGRMWVMEQQAGPVNWAPHNPVPAPGAVRLWTWEAFAHGAELVSYFRWRQCPYAQEQMHSGLNLPDDTLSPGGLEIRRAAEELAALKVQASAMQSSGSAHTAAKVALIFDYEADWMVETQRHGADFDYQQHVFEWYEALRSLGVDLDIVPAQADLSGYELVVAPTLPVVPTSLVTQIENGSTHWLFGPRTGSKTTAFAIEPNLPPGRLQAVLPVRVIQAESLRPSLAPGMAFDGVQGHARKWRDHAEPGPGVEVLAAFDDGVPAVLRRARVTMLAASVDSPLLRAVLAESARQAGIATVALASGVRTRKRDGVCFAFNYGGAPQPAPAPEDARFVLGGPIIGPVDVAAWIEER
ncbi:beta-galactosidase [Trinickia caryophylli]|uniref:Beta-galactosidase n=1 Tax=Trinickia caryophylli TaxID=28094 RepID=A0A1X7D7F8_TRICW|nr:beta-galactosidase [Trinickia caryophylli]PMS12643.1 beta-galactosidase [Trinickia caryophylli]TRX15049.1 beta-galactosidase [Trinickia caryophylli]WQE14908.1 beta-galactosidase [Trinickia caryophylli]SMF10257.1 beta-galactosidase [Trinickia caryophylli]GLU31366.1 beta-galactosidase [Trinickia caryophylli]